MAGHVQLSRSVRRSVRTHTQAKVYSKDLIDWRELAWIRGNRLEERTTAHINLERMVEDFSEY